MAATRIRWDRLGRWALIAVFAFVLYLYVGPLVSWVSTYREAGEKRQEVAALKARNAELKQRRRGAARQARAGARGPPAGHGQGRREGLRGRASRELLVSDGCRSRPPWSSGARASAGSPRRPPYQQDALERVTAPDRRRAAAPAGRRVHRRGAVRPLRGAGDRAGAWTSPSPPRPSTPTPGTRRIVADAAFARYLRGAGRAFAGGAARRAALRATPAHAARSRHAREHVPHPARCGSRAARRGAWSRPSSSASISAWRAPPACASSSARQTSAPPRPPLRRSGRQKTVLDLDRVAVGGEGGEAGRVAVVGAEHGARAAARRHLLLDAARSRPPRPRSTRPARPRAAPAWPRNGSTRQLGADARRRRTARPGSSRCRNGQPLHDPARAPRSPGARRAPAAVSSTSIRRWPRPASAGSAAAASASASRPGSAPSTRARL